MTFFALPRAASPRARRKLFAAALAGLLAVLLFAPAARAQDHLVSPDALQQQVRTSSATRQQNIDTVTNFLSTPIAERAMKSHHYDPVKVRSAIPTLSNAELANLASRANDAQQKFAAGFLGSGVLVLLILIIVVIIVVAAVH
ncbi:MAG TPA: PA2779 family protein [Acidobacteriaceae bacterium]|jgi:DNA-binding PucR family transcriptional regulator|nr:PA2779 family protein [Acidobacteriaceae bacterium]